MNQFRCFLLIILLSISGFTSAQSFVIHGIITEQKTNKPISFANIVADDGKTGCISEMNGHFALKSKHNIETITITCIGYETKTQHITNSDNELVVQLVPNNLLLDEVLVNAKNDPVFRIIDSVMAHRKSNNPDNLKSYSYTLYDRMFLTIDSSQLQRNSSNNNLVNGFDKMVQGGEIFAMETVSEVYFKAPRQKSQNVIGSKMSGMQDPIATYLVTQVQSTDFYNDHISIFNKEYLNPISSLGSKKYFFSIESTNISSGGDSLFSISFKPQRGTNFDGIEGIMLINSQDWAIQSVTTHPVTQNTSYAVVINQIYERIDSYHWYPTQFNTRILFNGKQFQIDGNNFPIVGIGNSYLTNIKINPEIDTIAFSHVAVNIQPDAYTRDNAFWNEYRYDSVSERILAAYRFMDSINNLSPIKFDKIMYFADAMSSDFEMPAGKINFNLDRTLNYSLTRGLYIGLGLSTNHRFSKYVNLSGYYGAWLGTKLNNHKVAPNYRAVVNFNLWPRYETQLSLRSMQKSIPLGDLNEFSEINSLINPVNYKYFFIDYPVNAFINNFTISTRFAQHFKAYVSLGVNQKYIDKIYQLEVTENNSEKKIYHTTDLGLMFRFAYNEKFVQTERGLRKESDSKLPVLWFSYARGLNEFLGGKYAYNKYQLQILYDKNTPLIGHTHIMIQGGKVDGNVPATELFNMAGVSAFERKNGITPFGAFCEDAFVTMTPNEFICNEFIALFFTHNFKNNLFERPHFKPELILVTNIGQGKMQPKIALNNDYTIQAKSMEKGYFESGILVDNMLKFGVIKLGVGCMIRYGAYADNELWKNLGWVACISIQ